MKSFILKEIEEVKTIMNDILGARYWYNESKQYGDELVSFRIFTFWNEELKKQVNKPYVDVFLRKSKLQNKKNYSSVEGYLDEEFFMERWTGAKDCFGREIYEGDIIEIVYDTMTDHYEQRRKVGVVRYGKPYPNMDWLDEFYFEDESDEPTSFQHFDYYISNEDMKVLGNVNENPEMYEKLKKGEL